jgi:hypothetical protein
LDFRRRDVSDVIGSVTTAISLAKRLRDISENIKVAEFKNVLADLSLELANVKLKLADVSKRTQG